MTGCDHRWVRARDRDRIKGPFADGRVGRTYLVLYCERCAKAVTREVDFDATLTQAELAALTTSSTSPEAVKPEATQ